MALFYNRDRLHFHLENEAEKSFQIAQGEMFARDTNYLGQIIYSVKLNFTGGMFGSFQQWVLFDFKTEPVLCRKVTVEVGTQSVHEKLRNLREQLTFDRWTSQNREIIPHETQDDCDEKLLAKYKEPSSVETVITGTTISTELNQFNYKLKMHTMLELEEFTRHQIISRYVHLTVKTLLRSSLGCIFWLSIC